MFDNFQERRQRVCKRFIYPGIALLAIGGIGFALVIVLAKGPYQLMYVGILGIIVLAIGMAQLKKIANDFKGEFLIDVLNKNFQDVDYNAKSGFSRQYVQVAEFLPHGQRFNSNDMIEASYNGVKFKMSDIHIEVRVKRDDHVTYETVFRGPFIELDFNKQIEGKVQVLERGRSTLFSKYERIKMESVEFNKAFKIYATKSHTAFYILTPHFMEKLMTIENEHRGAFFFSFIEGKVYVALDSRKDNFEVGIFKKFDDKLIEEFENQLDLVKDLIDELKLNKKLFG